MSGSCSHSDSSRWTRCDFQPGILRPDPDILRDGHESLVVCGFWKRSILVVLYALVSSFGLGNEAIEEIGTYLEYLSEACASDPLDAMNGTHRPFIIAIPLDGLVPVDKELSIFFGY